MIVATVRVFLTPSGLVVFGMLASISGLRGVRVCVTMLWLLIKLPRMMNQFVLAPIGLQSQVVG